MNFVGDADEIVNAQSQQHGAEVAMGAQDVSDMPPAIPIQKNNIPGQSIIYNAQGKGERSTEAYRIFREYGVVCGQRK